MSTQDGSQESSLNFRHIRLEELKDSRARARDTDAEESASRIIADVGARGETAVREWAEKLDGLKPGSPLILGKKELESALASLPKAEREVLERCHDRIKTFAEAQRASLKDLDISIPGGRAGHSFLPVSRAGCYAPGGRFPLPSSALMTATAAKAAGVSSVICVGPRPATVTLAAASIAGAEAFLAAGGAQGIAALAFGAGIAPCDVIVGPGGRYAAAAKRLLFGVVGMEAPAGPSELLVVAARGADAEVAAADLLAQAEHDVAAVPAIIVLEGPEGPQSGFTQALLLALENQLAALPEPNRSTAAAALGNGWILLARNRQEAVEAADRFAPEHLEILAADAQAWASDFGNAGAVFLGGDSAEVFGDYGAGPNHCLPTAGAARFAAGLSVLAFLRARTWLKMDTSGALVQDSSSLARLEGLEAHARAAEKRRIS